MRARCRPLKRSTAVGQKNILFRRLWQVQRPKLAGRFRNQEVARQDHGNDHEPVGRRRKIRPVPARQELWSNYDEHHRHFLRYDIRKLREVAQSSHLSIVSWSYFLLCALHSGMAPETDGIEPGNGICRAGYALAAQVSRLGVLAREPPVAERRIRHISDLRVQAANPRELASWKVHAQDRAGFSG